MPDLAALRSILKRVHPSLDVDRYADSRDAVRGSTWVTFAISGHKPLKLATLEALDPDLHGNRPAGTWVVEALAKTAWQQRVAEAKAQFARRRTFDPTRD